MVMTNPDRILRCKDVMALTGLSRSTLYAMMSEGTFPASIKLSKRAVGWRATVVQAWIDAR
ncbi:helix-turn-helix transcriptional regulator [Lutimaribacter marinistellae]|uniref:Helix-turn-helix transcriptional regulator n=1 Tax=Lutimaribacter marinistellae TaxID=1820329 RepID=A0ABV7TFX8_9RHOB